MSEQSRSGSLMAPVGLVWLISLLVGVPFVGIPKPASQTSATESRRSTSPGEVLDQKTSSRLWEDPLEATGALTYLPFKGSIAQAATGESAYPDDDKVSTESEKARIAKIGTTIFVLVRGFRYADMAEWRRQQRYAVQAALWSKGYSPLHGDQLFYRDISFRTIFGDGGKQLVRPGSEWYMRVPFEDFKYTEQEEGNGSATRVRVCYINTNLLDDRSLSAVCRIADILGLTGDGRKVSITSPPSTNWLQAMLAENVTDSTDPNKSPPFSEIELFNTLATGELKEFKDKDNKPRDSIVIHVNTSKEKVRPIRIHQLIEPDGATVRSILTEINLRGKAIGTGNWLGGGGGAIALVSEWGASFSELFAEEMRKESGENNVYRFNYLRGLNGLSPDGRSAGPAPEIQISGQAALEARTPGEALSRSIEPSPLPVPFGTTQFDYIARLGEQLRWENWNRRAKGAGAIRAIGLIGSDIDDKLALLKVLRPRFPDALFFTNEMDAEFLQPENHAFTHNLIVATRFGIDGRHPVKITGHGGRMPLFRTSAQSALVYSIHAALSADDRKTVRVRLYEMGLRRAHLLSASNSPDFADKPAADTALNASAVGQEQGIRLVWRKFSSWIGDQPIFGLFVIAIAFGVSSRLWWAKSGRPNGYRVIRKRLCSDFGNLWSSSSQPTASGGQATDSKSCTRIDVAWSKLFLGNRRPAFECNAVQKLRRGECGPFKEITATPLKESAGWWFYAALLALWGVIWWVLIPWWSGVIVTVAGILALAWMALRPREDHQRDAWWILGFAITALAAMFIGSHLPQLYRLDPLDLADGVNLWPAVSLRLLAAAMALFFTRSAWGDLCELRDQLTVRFFLEREGRKPGGVRHVNAKQCIPDGWNGMGLVPRDFPSVDQIDQGSNPNADSKIAEGDAPNEAVEWDRYLEKSDPQNPECMARWIRLTLAVLLIAVVAMVLTDFPLANSRGFFPRACDRLSLAIALGCLGVLCVFVGDQLWRCRSFVRLIWGHGTTAFGFELEESLLLIAKLTGGVGNLLIYPFGVCFVLICAHSGFFEQWLGLSGLYTVITLALGTLALIAWKMQRMAHAVKERTISHLQLALAEAMWMKRLILQNLDFVDSEGFKKPAEKAWWEYTVERLGRHLTTPETPRTLKWLLLRRANDEPESPERIAELEHALDADVKFQDARVRRVEQLIGLVREIKEGAFGGIHENPIVRGVLIPGAGLGSLELVQRLISG